MKTYLFIDESGDPNFFSKKKQLLVGKPGYQPLLIIGLITTPNRRALRDAVLGFRDSILSDVLYNSIPSIAKYENWLPHARNDHSEIHAKFFEFLRNLNGYKVHLVIGRKNIDIFTSKHNSKPEEFYLDLLYHLLKEKLKKGQKSYQIYLSRRQPKDMKHFQKALDRVSLELNHSVKWEYDIVQSNTYPEMSIVDYSIWAIQRHLLKNESRFYKALLSKYEFILDLYNEGSVHDEKSLLMSDSLAPVPILATSTRCEL